MDQATGVKSQITLRRYAVLARRGYNAGILVIRSVIRIKLCALRNCC